MTKEINCSKNEKVLIAVMMFYILSYFFTFLSFFWNGAINAVLYRSLGLFFWLVPWVTVFICGATEPKCLSQMNVRFAILFATSLFLVFFYLELRFGIQDTDLFLAASNGAILFLLNDKLKIYCFDIFVKIIAIVFFVSVIEYIIYVVVRDGIVTGYVIRNGGGQSFVQLLFNFIGNDSFIPRFQSLCEEPGVVGTVCGLLIFVLKGKERYRYHYWVFIVSGLLSFSLAFYVFLILHICTVGGKWWYVFLFVLAAFFMKSYFDEYIDYWIVERLGNGDISYIDTRVDDSLNMHLNRAWENGELLFGQGRFWFNTSGISMGAGGKVFIWKYGLIALFMLFSVYAYYYFKKISVYKSDRYITILFFVVLWISFYQRQWIYNMDYLVILLAVPMLNSSFFYKVFEK